MKNLIRLFSVCVLINYSLAIFAGDLYEFGEGFDQKLPAEDDFSTEEIVLKTPFKFYGQTYFSIFVNTNGLLSFLTEIPYFYNSQFPLDYPTIAPFYSDVDISKGGNIWYRESTSKPDLEDAKDELKIYFPDYDGYTPESLFIVTWEEVHGYGLPADKNNTYQVILVTNLDESFIIFYYLDEGLQWLQGGGKTSGLPDAIAQAGLISEDKRFYAIVGSGTDQVRNLDRWSNTDIPGAWAFRVGNILPEESLEVPRTKSQKSVEKVGEDSIETCDNAGEQCHSLATCHDYSTGLCCRCKEAYYGNGLNCLRKDEPIRVTGKVNGNINGINIVDADLHSYVLSNEGRTYTAASRVQKDIGYDLQSLVGIGEGIAWLFAVPEDNVTNGFILTGGKCNRSVEIDFPQTGHKAFVHQVFEGLDVFSNVAVSTTVKGSIPSVPYGSEIQVDPFQEEITKVHQGKLHARSNRAFRIKGQTLTTPFSVETFIDYVGCQHDEINPDEETLRLKIADNIFIRYDEAESIVRYSFSAKIGTLEDADPCIEGRKECGANSHCIVDGDKHRCVCEQGFDYIFDSLLNLYVCLDVNECKSGVERCDPEAICVNSIGSYSCTCRQGFVGNGYYCNAELSCENANCHKKAVCDVIEGKPRCYCYDGYRGDGYNCVSIIEEGIATNCHITQDCSPYAVCNPSPRGYSCQCLEGYFGNGLQCVRSDGVEYPHSTGQIGGQQIYPVYPQTGGTGPQPECLLDVCWCPNNFTYNRAANTCDDSEKIPVHIEFGRPKPICDSTKCACPEGFIYNELYEECDPIDKEPPGISPIPFCYENDCICPFGFEYNPSTLVCDAADLIRVESYPVPAYGINHDVPCDIISNCHPNALCSYIPSIGSSRCICNSDFEGDGYSCSPLEASCDQVNICSVHASCIYDDFELESKCVCNSGFIGDGILCNREDECSSIEDCDPNAQCLFDGRTQRFTCRCNSGYTGGGLICQQAEDPTYCVTIEDCDVNAQCLFDGEIGEFGCRCNSGYIGDGMLCQIAEELGCDLTNFCDRNAACIFDPFTSKHRCLCNPGYRGSGSVCEVEQGSCEVQNNCGENSECIFIIEQGSYGCVCNEGYEGDGITCRFVFTCIQDPTLCHEKATCQLNEALNMYGCVCQQGYAGDGSYCGVAEEFEKDVIIISRGLSILRMPIDSREGSGFPIHVDPFMTAVGADIDCFAGRFYWTDIDGKSIRSSKYDGSERKPLLTGGDIGFPEDVAVDWVARNVFWTDSTNNVVSVVTIDESMKRTVIEGGLMNPRGIAVHPGLGLLFWSDWDRNEPKIESAGMDGSNRMKLVSGPENILLPNSLIVDYETGMICWADAGTHRIECVSLDGYGRKRVIADQAKYPFGLTQHYRSFYYSDWRDNMIHEVNKYTGEKTASLRPPLGGSGKLYGIVAVPERCPLVSNVCQINRGNCGDFHICLPNGRGGRTCSCSDDDIKKEKCNDVFY